MSPSPPSVTTATGWFKRGEVERVRVERRGDGGGIAANLDCWLRDIDARTDVRHCGTNNEAIHKENRE